MNNRWLFILCSLVLFLSLGMRIYHLGTQSYWHDEMVSIHIAKNIIHEPLSNAYLWDNSPPLYHGLLAGWVYVFGDGEFATRFLSLIFSLATTIAFIYFGYSVGGNGGAVLFAFLQSISHLSITYAQETRMYGLLEFMATINMILLYKIIWQKNDSLSHKIRSTTKREIRFKGLYYVVTGLVMSVTHYFSVLGLFVQSGILSFYKAKQRYRIFIIIGGIAVSLFTGVFIYMSSFSWRHLGWQTLKYTVEPLSHWPIEVVMSLFNHSLIAGILTLILIVSTFVLFKGQSPNKKIVPLYYIGLVILIAQIGSLISKRALFLERYFIFLNPFWISLIGFSVLDFWQNKKHKKWATVFLVLFSILTIYESRKLYLPQKAPWRDVANHINQGPKGPVFTSRSVAIQTPYFERIDVPVYQWNPADKMEPFVKSLSVNPVLWIVDNYWGGLSYMDTLRDDLKTYGFKVSEMRFQEGSSDPLRVLLVQSVNK